MLTPWLRRHVDLLGESVEEETERRYRCMVDHDIAPFFKGTYLPVDAVTPDLDAASVEWPANELGNAPKPLPTNTVCCVPRWARRLAVGRRRSSHGIRARRPKLPKRTAPEVDRLSEDGFELVDELLAPRWRAWCQFGVMSMARPGEPLAARCTVR